MAKPKKDEPSAQDVRTKEIIENYTYGAMAAMIAIPIPGADMAATFAVWGKMLAEIAKNYGYTLTMEDATRLASDLFKGVILTVCVWFGSAKAASTVLKFIPGAGTVTAYLIDAAIAAFGAKKITTMRGTAGALYYKSGKTMAPDTMAEHVKNAADPSMVLPILSALAVGVDLTGGVDAGVEGDV